MPGQVHNLYLFWAGLIELYMFEDTPVLCYFRASFTLWIRFQACILLLN